MRTTRTLLALLALPLVLVACVSGKPSDEDSVRDAIRRYDAALATGYRTMDMNAMRAVAVRLQAEDEYIHMSSLAEGGVRLDPELRELRFVRVSVEASSAHAETRETWDYRHYSRADGKLVLEQKGLVYDLAWDLERQADRGWLVSDVRAIGATETSPPRTIGTPTPVPSQNP